MDDSDGPGCLARYPEFVQVFQIALSVHAGPEAAVFEHAELAIARQLDQRVALENTVHVGRKIGQKITLDREVAAIDPVVGKLGFFAELFNLGRLDFELTEPRGGALPGRCPFAPVRKSKFARTPCPWVTQSWVPPGKNERRQPIRNNGFWPFALLPSSLPVTALGLGSRLKPSQRCRGAKPVAFLAQREPFDDVQRPSQNSALLARSSLGRGPCGNVSACDQKDLCSKSAACTDDIRDPSFRCKSLDPCTETLLRGLLHYC